MVRVKVLRTDLMVITYDGLQIAERSLLSLIPDDELRQHCEDLLAADAHHDRMIREACMVLEYRVRQAIGGRQERGRGAPDAEGIR